MPKPEDIVNILAYCKSKFENFDCFYVALPKFLTPITNLEEKIILICKISNENFDNMERVVFTKDTSIYSNKLDLTGSPLKDEGMEDLDFSSEELNFKSKNAWAKEDERLLPIELEKVRGMICNPSFQSRVSNSPCKGSVWFICKPTVKDNTIFMSYNFGEVLNSRSFIKYLDQIENNAINGESLMSRHLLFLNNACQTETFIENSYKIDSNISLKLSWTTSAIKPQLINIKNCTTILFQEISVDNKDSVFEHFWRQLIILNIINEEILKFKNNQHDINNMLCKWGSGIDLDSLKETIIETMTDLPTYFSNTTNEISDIESVAMSAKKRFTAEITDKLWEILKCCSSYKDLKYGLAVIFQCAAQRNIINLPVNENSLAKLIREVSQQRLAIPYLSGTEPLELLLEIGLEKISKDYEYIITESKICGMKDLMKLQCREQQTKIIERNFNVRSTLLQAAQKFQNNPKYRKTLLHNHQNENSTENDETEIIGFKNTRYNEKQVEFKLAKLLQMHVALEHLLSIQINLNLKNVYSEIFDTLLQRPLICFPKSIEQYSDQIEVEIKTDKIVSHIEDKIPYTRRIQMTSSNKFKHVRSIFFYTKENIYPPNILESIYDITEENLNSRSHYFHSYYVTISTRRN